MTFNAIGFVLVLLGLFGYASLRDSESCNSALVVATVGGLMVIEAAIARVVI